METIFHQAEIQLIPSISLIPKIVSEPMFQSLHVRRLPWPVGGGLSVENLIYRRKVPNGCRCMVLIIADIAAQDVSVYDGN